MTRVPKPPFVRHRLFRDSLSSRRSLVHTRFDIDALLPAIDASGADIFVAEHSYMAETFLLSARVGHTRLVINTVNTESEVWRATRGLLGRLEYPRLLRDELRVAGAAATVGTYDADEADFYRNHGVPHARWVELTTPPAEQVDVAGTRRRLVFLGVRFWPPNQEAFLKALKLWPKISADIPDAGLCVVGTKKPGAAEPALPHGVRDLGFLEDVDTFLSTCRAMIAPVKTGGGLRAKILHAASRGLPVVATSPGIGSLGPLLGLTAHDTDEDFIEQCRRYLLDREAAAVDGARIYELNRQHWLQGRPHQSIAWLLGSVPPFEAQCRVADLLGGTDWPGRVIGPALRAGRRRPARRR
jgi:glycosyltransferase involved in cell wall biosynthesis